MEIFLGGGGGGIFLTKKNFAKKIMVHHSRYVLHFWLLLIRGNYNLYTKGIPPGTKVFETLLIQEYDVLHWEFRNSHPCDISVVRYLLI